MNFFESSEPVDHALLLNGDDITLALAVSETPLKFVPAFHTSVLCFFSFSSVRSFWRETRSILMPPFLRVSQY